MTDFNVGLKGNPSEIKEFFESNQDVCRHDPNDTFTLGDCTHTRLSFKDGTTEEDVKKILEDFPNISTFRVDKALCCHKKF